MSARIARVVVLLVGSSFLLTACDPPMPPEVKAALAEQSYTCESGDTKLYATDSVAAVAGDWTSSVEANCPGMTISLAKNDDDSAELVIGSQRSGSYSSVPFAVDATVLVVNLPDITNVSLSAAAIEKIWNGKITSWDDPTIAKLNPNFTMPATPITFGVDPEVKNLKAFQDWISRLAGHDIEITGGKANLETLTDGSLIVTDFSTASALSSVMVGIVSPYSKEGVVPTIESINSGASMFKTKVEGGNVLAQFDAKAKPIPPSGVNEAPAPYEAVWLISLNLFGTESLKTRAAARYLLRQDSQGSLGMSNVVAIPENLRFVALDVVSKGLPEPVITEQPN